MLFLIFYVSSIILAHVLMFFVTKKIGPPPSSDRFVIVIGMFLPFINTVICGLALVILIAGYSNAPLLKFYKFIFNEGKDV